MSHTQCWLTICSSEYLVHHSYSVVWIFNIISPFHKYFWLKILNNNLFLQISSPLFWFCCLNFQYYLPFLKHFWFKMFNNNLLLLIWSPSHLFYCMKLQYYFPFTNINVQSKLININFTITSLALRSSMITIYHVKCYYQLFINCPVDKSYQNKFSYYFTWQI